MEQTHAHRQESKSGIPRTGYLVPGRDTPRARPNAESSWDVAAVAAVIGLGVGLGLWDMGWGWGSWDWVWVCWDWDWVYRLWVGFGLGLGWVISSISTIQGS